MSDNLVEVFLARLQPSWREPGRCLLLGPMWLPSCVVDVAALSDEELLAHDFLYVPICSHQHWVGAVVCKCSDASYRILVLDTLYDSPFDVDLHCGQIRDVLTFTWRSHRPDPAPHVTWSKVRGVPTQPNLVDCALYMALLFQMHNETLPALHLHPEPHWQPAIKHSVVANLRTAVLQELRLRRAPP